MTEYNQKVAHVQQLLQSLGLDGWLIFDFQKKNTLAIEFLQIPTDAHLTRRMYYWIPKEGAPVKILHAIEPHFLDKWPGEKKLYSTWQSLQKHLSETLKASKKVAMEYSYYCHIPYASLVDAGTVDWVRSFGCEVLSSAGFAQAFTCTLSSYQKQTHFEAAAVLDSAAASAWELIADRFSRGLSITEYDVQQHIKEFYTSKGFISEADPICAVNEHSSDPHYSPKVGISHQIKNGDFILIDLWCKKNEECAVYADISRVAVLAGEPTKKQQEIFSIVRKAQKNTADYIRERLREKSIITGSQADRIARHTIEQAGYGDYFIHRTGHNIYTKDHGPGAHLDSYETEDDRPLLANTCFSIEPGIYLPNEFGVRLEYDVLLTEDGQIVISGGEQDQIKTLL